MRRGPRSIIVLALVTALTGGCVGHARTEPDYLADVVNTTKMVVSTLETARLTVDAVAQRRSTSAYASLLLSEAEGVAQSTVTTFAGVQPPSPELDAARAELLAAMNEATTILGDLRLAAFRDDFAALPRIAERIAPVRDRLKQLGRAASV